MTNSELRILVNKSVLLSAETREEVLENLETLDDEQKQKLEELLVAAQQKQDELFLAAFKANPNLLVQIKADLHNAAVKNIQEKEKISQQSETKTLDDLEKEINTLFD